MTSDALTRLADALPDDSEDHGPVAVASDDIRTVLEMHALDPVRASGITSAEAAEGMARAAKLIGEVASGRATGDTE